MPSTQDLITAAQSDVAAQTADDAALAAAQAKATADAATVSGDDLAVLFSGSSSLPPWGPC